MILVIGITITMMGICLSLLTTIGIVTAGLSALPLGVWGIMLIASIVASFAGLSMATSN